MSVAFYGDEHVSDALATALAARGVDMLLAVNDGMSSATDEDILDHATNLGRVVFTNDRDFLKIAALRIQTGEYFAGIVYCHQERLSLGETVDELEYLGQVAEPSEMINAVKYIPLIP